MTNPADYQVDGLVRLDGGGQIQEIEMPGFDFGNSFAALSPWFSKNYNIGEPSHTFGTLEIADNSYVRLIDLFDNDNRGGFGTELDPSIQLWSGSPALYVWNLIIGDDVTIRDLNGLHLYYRAGNLTEGNDVTIINGPEGDNRVVPIPVVPEPTAILLLTATAALGALRRREIS